MRHQLTLIFPLAAFVLGVGVAATAPSQAQLPVPEVSESVPAVLPTVRALRDTARRVAPSGKASVRLLAEGRQAFVGLLTLAAGAQVPEHRDASEETLHVMKGSGTITIDDLTYALRPGTTVFMPANAKVRYANGPEELVAIQVFAGPESAAKYLAWPIP